MYSVDSCATDLCGHINVWDLQNWNLVKSINIKDKPIKVIKANKFLVIGSRKSILNFYDPKNNLKFIGSINAVHFNDILCNP